MNSNFRNLAIWVVIGLLLMALFNLFQNPRSTAADVDVVPGESRKLPPIATADTQLQFGAADFNAEEHRKGEVRGQRVEVRVRD